MISKELHLQLPQSLTSTKCCCNSGSTSSLAGIVLAGHKTHGITMARGFVVGLSRVKLQWLFAVPA